MHTLPIDPIELNGGEYEFVPFDYPTTRQIAVLIEGLGLSFSNEDSDLEFFAELLGKNFQMISKYLEKKYALKKPELIFKPNINSLGVKISMIEKEDYEQRKKVREMSIPREEMNE